MNSFQQRPVQKASDDFGMLGVGGKGKPGININLVVVSYSCKKQG